MSVLVTRMYGDHSLNEFKDNVTKVFKAFGEVLKSTEKELHKVQVCTAGKRCGNFHFFPDFCSQ